MLLVFEKFGIVFEDVKSFVKEVSFSDVLEIEVLRRKIFVFYWFKGWFGLVKYDDENLYIIGFEDKEDEYIFKKFFGQEFLRKCFKYFSNKKRKYGDEVFKCLNYLEESEKKEELGIDIVVDLLILLVLFCKRVKVDDVFLSVERNNGSGEIIVYRGKRERKKSKYFLFEYMIDFSWSRRKSKLEFELVEKMIKSFVEKVINFVSLGVIIEEILEFICVVFFSI